MSFDTRHKIITIDQARELAATPGDRPTAFVSHLEVLRAAHVRKLEEIAAGKRGKLFVILTDPPTNREAPLVPLESRAEIAAALRVVDYVIPAPHGSYPALAAVQAGTIIQDEEEDRERTRLLIEHVRSRAEADAILVVRLGAMGDILHALPAAASLKLSFPHRELVWVADRHGFPCSKAILTSTA